jgi:4-amino-4-deoxy-L-arabinose transferase-like glycosyltransferase
MLAVDSPLPLAESAPKALSSTHGPARHVLLLAALATLMFFLGLGRLPLIDPDEGRNAEVAREMLVSGDWITPHFNTLAYLDKPAVYFWLVASSFRLWGISEWSARFPSALMALATMLLVWFLGRRMFGDSTGFRAGVILAVSPLTIVFSRLVIFDMTFTFLVTLAMAAFWLGEAEDFSRPALTVLMFASMGLATITKGPVGFLLPLLSIVAYEAARGRLRGLKGLRWGLGGAAFLAAALPWFIAVALRNPDFPRYALWQESLLRFASGYAHRAGGPLYYVPIYLAGFFPWSFFLSLAGWNHLKNWRELRRDSNQPIMFLLAWAVVIFTFFTISRSKLPAYFLPAIVPLSILMGRVWAEAESHRARRPVDWITAGFACLLGLGLVVASASRFLNFADVETGLLRNVPPMLIAMVSPLLLYTGLILIALAFLGRKLAARLDGRALAPAAFVLLALAVPLIAIRWSLPLRTSAGESSPLGAYAREASSRRLANTILTSPEKGLPVYGFYYFRPGLPFYLRHPVGLVTADAGEMTSNYVAARLLQHGPQALQEGRAEVRDGSGPGMGQELPRGVIVVGAAELERDSRAGLALVMVRNSQVGKLASAVEGTSPPWAIWPLWSEWGYSVWKIAPAKTETGK